MCAFGRGFEEVADDGLVGVEANSGVLQVDDDGVEFGEVFGLGPLVGVLGAVEADDGEVGGGVGLGGDFGGVLLAEDAVLGREERGEFQAGDEFRSVGGEQIDGAAAFAVEAGLVGEQAEAQMIVVACVRLRRGRRSGWIRARRCR